jgi:hypothetical protein
VFGTLQKWTEVPKAGKLAVLSVTNEELNAKGITFSILGENKKASNYFFYL